MSLRTKVSLFIDDSNSVAGTTRPSNWSASTASTYGSGTRRLVRRDEAPRFSFVVRDDELGERTTRPHTENGPGYIILATLSKVRLWPLLV